MEKKQKPQLQDKQVVENRPRLGQGRPGIRHQKLQPFDGKVKSTSKLWEIPKIPMVQNVTKDSSDFPLPQQLIMDKKGAITRGTIQDKYRELPFYPDPIYMPPPRPPENLWPPYQGSKLDSRPKIDIEFEETLPYQEGIISKFYQRPNKSYFQKLRDLESLINTSRLVQKFLPKQADIDKILKVIQQKVLKGMHI